MKWRAVIGCLVAQWFVAGCLLEGEQSLIEQKDIVEADVSSGLCQVTQGATQIDFETQVKPIFSGNGCFGCHISPEKLSQLPATIGTGRATQQPIVVPCDPSSSSLFRVISSGCSDPQAGSARKMPPGSAGLSEADSQIIQQWILEGAKPTFEAGACP